MPSLYVMTAVEQDDKCRKIETYAALLRKCTTEKNLVDGKRVHQHLVTQGFEHQTFLSNLLLQMYSKCGNIGLAAQLFEKMRRKDAFSWNIMIAAFSENGQIHQAEQTFQRMEQRDIVSWNAMLAAYGQNEGIDKAEDLFSGIPFKNAVSWNIMISAYAHSGHHKRAFKMFWMMCLEGTKPNENSFITILEVCFSLSEGTMVYGILMSSGLEASLKVGNAVITMFGECGSLEDSKRMFDRMVQRDVITWTAMIAAYAQNGHVEESRKLFDEMPAKNVVSWNAMIVAYAVAGDTEKAFEVFKLMDVKPNRVTFLSILSAGLELTEGKEIHTRIIDNGFETNVMVATALCTMYGMCGSLEEARQVFDKMPKHDTVSWNSMITGYVQNGEEREALEMFHKMDLEGVEVNYVTILSALDACASLSVQYQGKLLHKRAVQTGMLNEVKVANTVVNMYGKCGNIDVAREIFEGMHYRNVSSWNVLVTTYGQNGLGQLGVDCFRWTCLEGFDPDDITFLEVLSACSHSGLLDEGVEFFVSMLEDWGIEHNPRHFMCMIDLLGRASELAKAEELIRSMPFEPEDGGWKALLGSCRVNFDIQRGERAAENIILMDPEDSSPYVIMSNMYACTQKWDYAERMRMTMEERNVKKEPGLSWIELRGRVHTFAANDKLHPRKEEIYKRLDMLFEELKLAGYVPDTKVVAHNVCEERKLLLLKHHSEKLAITFGLMSTECGSPLFIIKNLRVCSDCHSASKFISQVTKRRIIMRDGSRFHRFEGGQCSCGDYW